MSEADILAILARLIAHDTTSRNSNLDLVAEVEAMLAVNGVSSRRVPSEDGTKASLIATIGPAHVPGIVLSAHVDTVPVDGQAWTGDPFTLRRHGERVLGRGVTDMKGFAAVCLAAVPEMLAKPLSRPLHICLSYDEEVGCLATPALIEALLQDVARPLACIVGEPTGMGVVIGHKGKRALDIVVEGTPGHSSLAPRFVNAVEYAARLGSAVQLLARRLEREGTRDALYDVPHSTAHVGSLHGGSALNMVPERATLALEVRVIAADDARALLREIEDLAMDVLLPEMQAVAPGARIKITSTIDYPPLDTPEDSDIVGLAKRLAGRNSVSKVAYGTEGGRYSAAAIPTVVVGPGSIADAHQPDESIAIAELVSSRAFISRLIADCR
jgi:acetylornithine deacetylase